VLKTKANERPTLRENELYPRWQVGQYLQTMFTTHYDEIDNDRYPDLKWTSLADLVAQRP
jgi:hypothetical protein